MKRQNIAKGSVPTRPKNCRVYHSAYRRQKRKENKTLRHTVQVRLRARTAQAQALNFISEYRHILYFRVPTPTQNQNLCQHPWRQLPVWFFFGPNILAPMNIRSWSLMMLEPSGQPLAHVSSIFPQDNLQQTRFGDLVSCFHNRGSCVIFSWRTHRRLNSACPLPGIPMRNLLPMKRGQQMLLCS